MRLKKLLIVGIFLLISTSSFTYYSSLKSVKSSAYLSKNQEIDKVNSFYDSLNIPDLNREAFAKSLSGYYLLSQQGKLKNQDLLTIIDFTKSSDQERLFIIDMKRKILVDKSLVAHGRNSGEVFAKYFSNIEQSYQSSLGFYLTAETYFGDHGYSLRLDGLEQNFNDKARDRAIVIHGADYVSKAFIKNNGRLGRSFGCPALPIEKTESIINLIKEKSCLFIYSPSDDYITQSLLTKAIIPENWRLNF